MNISPLLFGDYGKSVWYTKPGFNMSYSVKDNLDSEDENKAKDYSSSYKIIDSEKQISVNLSTVKDVKSADVVADGEPIVTEKVESPEKKPISDDVVLPDYSQGYKMVEYGKLGENIGYIIYEDGLLYICGYGEMYNYDPCNSSVTKVGGSHSPLHGKTDIKEVIIENSDETNGQVITSIGEHVFEELQFTSVEMPDTIEIIGACAFLRCIKLNSIIFPESLTNIDTSAFSGCSELSEIVFSNNLVSIGEKAFKNCINLNSIEIPSQVTTIGENAFSNCAKLTEIVVPGNVSTIEEGAFSDCTNLVTAKIEQGVMYMGANMFKGCKKLEKLTLPGTHIAKESPESQIGDYSQVSDLFYKNSSHAAYNDLSGEFAISKYVIRKIVITGGDTILNNAFNGMNTLEEIIIPDTVTSIGTNAFKNCLELTQIEIPDGVVDIGDDAFNSCINLKSIDLPSHLTTIGKEAFSYCAKLTEIVVPSNVSTIGEGAFSECTELITAKIEPGIKYMGADMFKGCKKLEELTLPEAHIAKNKSEIGGYSQISDLFYKNSNYTAYNTQSSEFAISKYVINKVIVTGGSIIPRSAFNGMETLKEIVIPETVTEIGANAFKNCINLEKLTVLSNTSLFIETSLITDAKNVVIHCYTNSDAHKYAESNGIKYVLLDELPATTEPDKPVKPEEITHTYIYGDINNDTRVDITDLTCLSLYLLGDRGIDEITLKYADICGDNNGVDLADLAFFKQYISKDPTAILPVSDAA